ncbi:helix-turn-helix transcriptional regulator [Actinoallomurus liliacearum]|uniref:Helix-turn-helix transcriptional regulator n=2 Tax=Actinoallomurus liliacearum TaxID=1080073 RepID=A0ABP8TMB0_9ACTN
MGKRGRATLRAQWLGHLLRDLREANGLTLKDAAEYLQRDLSMISRFETGVYPIRRGDVMALIDLYGVEEARQREILLHLATEVWQKGWWDKYSGQVDGSLIDLVWLESRAEYIGAYSIFPVTSLLQIRAYATALIRAADPDAPVESVERWVELRMSRQRILDGSVQLDVVLDEAALRRSVGGSEVMNAQIRHILTAAERPNVDIRVLPFTVGAHASPDGGFRLIKMADPFPKVAHVEGPGGSLYVESAEAERLAARYDRLRESALDPDDSIGFITALGKELA